jgi:LL-diaminopimelate aminotransferase
MIELSQRVRALPGYPLAHLPAIKRRLIEEGMDVIDVGAGDNDAPPPAIAVETLRDGLADPALSKYGFQQGLPAYRRACVAWVARRYGHQFDPVTETLPLLGSKEGLSHLPYAVVNPGDVVLVPEPGYQAYIGGAILSGATPHILPLRREEDFLVELERLPADLLGRTKLVYLNYPNNPTAAVADHAYLERTVAVCRKHDILLAYDNAYCDLTYDGYHAPSIFDVEGARDVALEFFSLSKSYSMTGWRLGFVVGRKELVGALQTVKSYVDTGPFLALQKAGAAALEHAETIVEPIRVELQRRRDAAIEALAGQGVALAPPKAAMYLWVPLPEGVASAHFAKVALERYGALVLPGSAFGPAGEGYYRIALTVPAERLREAVARLGKALEAARDEPVAARA